MTHFGTSAKYIDALAKIALVPRKDYTLAALRTMISTGSPLAPECFDYVYRGIKADLRSRRSPAAPTSSRASCSAIRRLPVWRGEIQCRGLGMAVDVFDERRAADAAGSGESGELVCTRAVPVDAGRLLERSRRRASTARPTSSAFPTSGATATTRSSRAHGGLIIHGRSDATLNPGGVRIGTAEIYRQVEKLDEVVESLVIGQDWRRRTTCASCCS